MLDFKQALVTPSLFKFLWFIITLTTCIPCREAPSLSMERGRIMEVGGFAPI
jgi:hypothetical protein